MLNRFEKMQTVVRAIECNDEKTIISLLNEADGWQTYSDALTDVAICKKDPQQLRRLLDLHGLNKGVFQYKHAVMSAFNAVARDNNITPYAVFETLLAEFKGDLRMKNRALASIFECVADMGENRPNKQAATLLIQNGADLGETFDIPVSQMRRDMSLYAGQIHRLHRFRAQLFPN